MQDAQSASYGDASLRKNNMNALSLLLGIIIGLIFGAGLVSIIFLMSRKKSDDSSNIIRDELRTGREEASKAARELREEIANNLKSTNETLSSNLTGIGGLQQSQLEGMNKQLNELTEANQRSLERIRCTVDTRVNELQTGNEKKLEEMRQTVDEKLHATLEKRLGESFNQVSERLEAVHRGLGEMQNLATGVGDLKKVLSNVKVRGTWAEIRLEALLDQILAPGQYGKNVCTKDGSRDLVEFAIKLPGPKDDPDSCVWIPIDSKFPKEDYDHILEASERGDSDAVLKATDNLARNVKGLAQLIHDKYVNPPQTTDFAIMFLATEGLYAEVLRQPGLAEQIQHQWHIIIAGPTTLMAILSSLQLGFQTLAIKERTVEVWKILAAVRTEFGKFGVILDKAKKQLDTAAKTIEQTGIRTRAMERKLSSVERLPESEASKILQLPGESKDIDSDETETYDGEKE